MFIFSNSSSQSNWIPEKNLLWMHDRKWNVFCGISRGNVCLTLKADNVNWKDILADGKLENENGTFPVVAVRENLSWYIPPHKLMSESRSIHLFNINLNMKLYKSARCCFYLFSEDVKSWNKSYKTKIKGKPYELRSYEKKSRKQSRKKRLLSQTNWTIFLILGSLTSNFLMLKNNLKYPNQKST